MKILVTGSTGFIGNTIVRALADQGHTVFAFSREGSPRRANIEKLSNSHIVPLFINPTMDSISATFLTVKPDAVFHLAALTLVDHTPEDIDALIQSNLLLGVQLLEASAKSGVRIFLNTGSYWQDGDLDDPGPCCLYAATKNAFEMLLNYYDHKAGLKTVSLRLNDVFGAGDGRRKIFYPIRDSLLDNLPLRLSPGEQLMAPVHVDDVVSAFTWCLQLLEENPDSVRRKTFSVGPKSLISVQQLVGLFETVAGRKVDARWGALPYRPHQIMKPSLRELLPHWAPKISIEEGIKELLKEGLQQRQLQAKLEGSHAKAYLDRHPRIQ